MSLINTPSDTAQQSEADAILDSMSLHINETVRLIDALQQGLSPILRSPLPEPAGCGAAAPRPGIQGSTAPIIEQLINMRNAISESNMRISDLITRKAV